MNDTLDLMKACESTLDFWDNEEDAVWDEEKILTARNSPRLEDERVPRELFNVGMRFTD